MSLVSKKQLSQYHANQRKTKSIKTKNKKKAMINAKQEAPQVIPHQKRGLTMKVARFLRGKNRKDCVVLQSGSFTMKIARFLRGKNRKDSAVLQSGSLTVEAALVFPLVLFVLLLIMSLFRILQVEQMTAEALALAGEKTAIEANPSASEGEDSRLYGMAFLYFNQEIIHQKCPVKYISGQNLGFDFSGSSTKGENIDLIVSYKLTLPGGILNQWKIPVKQRVSIKKWTGYHGGSGDGGEDDWVYITETGTVYHVNRECTYLKLSIQMVTALQLLSLSYSPCMICGRDNTPYAYYYITQEGGRYHTRLDCSGLKRTIYMIKLSQVNGRGKCSRCGKG
ncbi:hypothetical protein FACS1894111_08350 [Clostridia bacterium]|nr:hypothetical protein FACS1894111_08350 [Clostridia bacterium]